MKLIDMSTLHSRFKGRLFKINEIYTPTRFRPVFRYTSRTTFNRRYRFIEHILPLSLNSEASGNTGLTRNHGLSRTGLKRLGVYSHQFAQLGRGTRPWMHYVYTYIVTWMFPQYVYAPTQALLQGEFDPPALEPRIVASWRDANAVAHSSALTARILS